MSSEETAGAARLSADWLQENPDVEFATLAAVDLNGVLRGKRLPRALIGKALAGELKMPLALMGVDIWGRDVVGSGQVFETGDRDGFCMPTERGLIAVNWLSRPEALLMTSLHKVPGEPYEADPRNILASVLARYAALQLTPVCATELEFFLYDPALDSAAMSAAPGAGGRGRTSAIYAVSELETFDPFLRDVYAACALFGIPAETAIAESGFGQFEVNFRHVDDALRAADDAQYFKHLVKGIARAHGMGATFMAKPFGEDSGSGLHIHFSLSGKAGANVFDNGEKEGSDLLRWAVGGMLRYMADTTLCFAPHYNSYRRLRSETHAPVNIAWGYENRTTAIRIPDSPPGARRIEHRVAGADANPYLVMAAILAAGLEGIEGKIEPPSATTGSAYEADLATLPTTWTASMETFAGSSFNRRAFGELMPGMFLACKKQEFESFANIVSPLEYDIYLERA